MREIKFRAWDNCSKEMEYSEVMPDLHFWKWVNYNPETIVMRYTELKDKSGKEIYEGDIVELTNTYKGMNTKSIVEIDFIDFTFAGKWAEEYSPSGYMYNPLGSYNFPIVTIEVIGNIYENPELLKE